MTPTPFDNQQGATRVPPTFNSGDVVMLTSGSLKMNVHRVTEAGMVEVVFMDREGRLQSAELRPVVLKHFVPQTRDRDGDQQGYRGNGRNYPESGEDTRDRRRSGPPSGGTRRYDPRDRD